MQFLLVCLILDSRFPETHLPKKKAHVDYKAYTQFPEEFNSADRNQNDVFEIKREGIKTETVIISPWSTSNPVSSCSLKQTKRPCTELSLWAQSCRWWTDFKVFRDGQYCSEGVTIAKSAENATSHQEPQFNQSLWYLRHHYGVLAGHSVECRSDFEARWSMALLSHAE